MATLTKARFRAIRYIIRTGKLAPPRIAAKSTARMIAAMEREELIERVNGVWGTTCNGDDDFEETRKRHPTW